MILLGKKEHFETECDPERADIEFSAWGARWEGSAGIRVWPHVPMSDHYGTHLKISCDFFVQPEVQPPTVNETHIGYGDDLNGLMLTGTYDASDDRFCSLELTFGIAPPSSVDITSSARLGV